MSGRGKDNEMKNRRTNLDPQESHKSGADGPQAADSMVSPVTPNKPEVRLGREVQARIGQQLRSMYDDFVNQGVPQNITDLVRRLSEQE
jgi:hypothetical protein